MWLSFNVYIRNGHNKTWKKEEKINNCFCNWNTNSNCYYHYFSNHNCSWIWIMSMSFGSEIIYHKLSSTIDCPTYRTKEQQQWETLVGPEEDEYKTDEEMVATCAKSNEKEPDVLNFCDT